MSEQTQKGDTVRDYFLQCEKVALSLTPNFSNPAEAARAWANEYEMKQLAERQRDEAIKTKAYISDKKTATAMATTSKYSRENEKLKTEIGDSKTYKQVKAIPWLKEFFNFKNLGIYGQVGKQLSRLSKNKGCEIVKIPNSEFGYVNAYHIDIIADLKYKLSDDLNMMKRFRI